MLKNDLSQNNAFMPKKLSINLLKPYRINKNYMYLLIEKLFKKYPIFIAQTAAGKSIINEIIFYKKVSAYLATCLVIMLITLIITLYIFYTHTLINHDQLVQQSMEIEALKAEYAILVANNTSLGVNNTLPMSKNFIFELFCYTSVIVISLATVSVVGAVFYNLPSVAHSVLNEIRAHYPLLAHKFGIYDDFTINLVDTEGYTYKFAIFGVISVIKLITADANIEISEIINFHELHLDTQQDALEEEVASSDKIINTQTQ